MASTLLLALIGGLISFVSTSVGSFLIFISDKAKGMKPIQISIDFAVGTMLSAAAFSLIGPEILKATVENSSHQLHSTIAGLAFGFIFIGFVSKLIHRVELSSTQSSSHLVLATALIFHNFPEGMGSGASLAGLHPDKAIPLQTALTVQNVVEGLLMTIVLVGLGWKRSHAVIGGVFSGFVELIGAVGAGLILEQTQSILPFLLNVAGGAMLMSVLIELLDKYRSNQIVHKQQFALGLLSIPIMNFLIG